MTTSRLIGLCMGLGAAVALADPVPVATLDETDMFPFVPSYDAPENVVNMSHLLDAPAGKHGRIRVEGGHFVNNKGRVRLQSRASSRRTSARSAASTPRAATGRTT